MMNVIKSNFKRLKKDKLFYLAIISMILLGTYVIVGTLIQNSRTPNETITDISVYILDGFMFSTVPIAIALAFFFGTEYNNGTIRNKLISGISRTKLYFGNLITAIIISISICLGYILMVCIFGSIFIGPIEAKLSILMPSLLFCFLAIFTLTTFFTMLFMLIHNKSGLVALLIILSFLQISLSNIIISRLKEPEYYDAYSYINDNGDKIDVTREKNHSYLKGNKRKVYLFLNDYLPINQIIGINEMYQKEKINNDLLIKYLIYSSISIIIITSIGIIIFKKQDIK